jgi:hypothetical protein
MIEGIDGELISLRQARRISQQKPELSILWRRLSGLLRIRNGGVVIIALERVLRRTRLPCNIDARSPTEIRTTLADIVLRFLIGLLARGWGGAPATNVECLAKGLADKAKNHDNAKARERNPAFHSITTLYKF